MYPYEPEQQSASIVLIGSFTPTIFSPAWLAKIGVITDKAAAAAAVNLIHPELTQFAIDRFTFEALINRLTITTTKEPFLQILDDVLAIFTTHLPHTPLSKLGINYDIQFKLDSAEQRVALGRKLAPLEPWGAFGKSLEREKMDEVGGMVSLSMHQGFLPDRTRGWRRVLIEPWQNAVMQNHQTGVHMNVNDHYEIAENDVDGAGPLIEILKDRFETSISQSKAIISEMMSYAKDLK